MGVRLRPLVCCWAAEATAGRKGGVAATVVARLYRVTWRRAVGEVVAAVRMRRLARRRVVAAKAGVVCEVAATAARLLRTPWHRTAAAVATGVRVARQQAAVVVVGVDRQGVGLVT